jgi:hypothetical protein
MKQEKHILKKLVGILLFFIFSISAASACDLRFTLQDRAGVVTELRAGDTVSLENGMSYTLHVVFREDHGRCLVAPEETIFLMEEEKWKPSKDYLPLTLENSIIWKAEDAKSYGTDLTFSAASKGTFKLDIIRECSKGGYEEYILFVVK